MLRVVSSNSNQRLIRCISTTTISSAPFKQKDGKSKQKMVRKVERVEVKKSTTLTHLPFQKAISSLGLEKLAPKLENVDDLKLDSPVGKVYKYPKSHESKLRSFGGFKKLQYHEGFQHPISLSTSNTLRIEKEFVSNLEGPTKNNRIYIDGIKGCGKSTLLNQAISLSLSKFNNDLIVLHFDNTEMIGNGSSNYIFNSKLGLYQQPMITRRWIKKILGGNEEIFKKLKLTKDVKFTKDKLEIKLQKGKHSIYDFLFNNYEFGKNESHLHFEFLIDQLKFYSKDVPILFSIDNFNSLGDNSLTNYKSPDFKPIHINQFELSKFIIDVISGEINFEKGGILLSKCNDFNPNRKTIETAIYQNETENNYMKQPIFDINLSKKFIGIKPFKVDKFSLNESRELLKIWQNQGILINRKDFIKEDLNQEINQDFDFDNQFEKLVKESYNTSQGNPLGMFKQIALTY